GRSKYCPWAALLYLTLLELVPQCCVTRRDATLRPFGVVASPLWLGRLTGGWSGYEVPPDAARRGAAGASWVARRRSRMSRRASIQPFVLCAMSTRVSAPPARNDVSMNTPTVYRRVISCARFPGAKTHKIPAAVGRTTISRQIVSNVRTISLRILLLP